MILISGGLKKAGLYNDMPDLTDLDGGDIKYQIDFREVYATILSRWLNTDSRAILGRNYQEHAFV